MKKIDNNPIHHILKLTYKLHSMWSPPLMIIKLNSLLFCEIIENLNIFERKQKIININIKNYMPKNTNHNQMLTLNIEMGIFN